MRKHEPHPAHSTVAAIRKAIRSLRKFPNRGREGREEGTRDLLVERLPHVVAYSVKRDAVEILHIWHPAQDR
jgi:toxin ParE1/3/4